MGQTTGAKPDTPYDRVPDLLPPMAAPHPNEDRIRAVGVVGLGVVVGVMPEIGPNRFTLVALILLVLLPIVVVVDRLLGATFGSDRYLVQGVVDAAMVIVFLALAPHLWIPVLVILALTLSAYILRIRALGFALLSALAVTTVGFVAAVHRIDGWLLPLVVLLAGLAPLAAFATVIRSGERELIERTWLLMRNAGALLVDRRSGEVLGPVQSVSGLTQEAFVQQIAAAGGPERQAVDGNQKPIRIEDGTGQVRWFHTVEGPLDDEEKSQSLLVDVTESVRAREAADEYATRDPLTGFLRQEAFISQVNLMTSPRQQIQVLYVALGDLGRLLDRVGARGIEHIVKVQSERLARMAQGVPLGRVGPSGLAIACTRDSHSWRRFSAQLVEALDEPILVDNTRIVAQSTVGVSFVGLNGTAADLLLSAEHAAAVAVEERRRVGGGASTKAVDIQASQTVSRISRHMDDELELWFQPIVDLQTGEAVSFEGLLRSTIDQRNSAWFLPALESLGLSRQIDMLALDHITRAALVLQRARPGVVASFNLSEDSLIDPNLPNLVERALVRYGVDPASLTVEISERGSGLGYEAARTTVRDLSSIGVNLALDDYGTGVSSLERIRDLPIDEIKIDQVFIRSLVTSPRDQTLVGTTLAMANELGLVTVAEGVEDSDTAALLHSLGCDRIQGYFISKAIPLNHIEHGSLPSTPAEAASNSRSQALAGQVSVGRQVLANNGGQFFGSGEEEEMAAALDRV